MGQGAEVKKFNPTGKLPALEHDGHWVCDSTDMAYYLEEVFPDKPVIPADPHLRGLVHALEDWADESLYWYEMTMRFSTPGNAQRNIPRMMADETGILGLMGKYGAGLIRKGIVKMGKTQGVARKSPEQLLVDVQRHISAVENMLHQRDWLVADHLTLGDLGVHCMFQCFKDADMVVERLEQSPGVMAWMQRLEEATDGPLDL